MPVIPDLPWTARRAFDGPGTVLYTELHLRRLRDVPAFMATSLTILRQVARSPGARAAVLRAQPLARSFATVSWWDDEAAMRTFARTDPHRTAMRRWAPRLSSFGNSAVPSTGTVPTVDAAARARAAAPPA
ncbi:hypothetical protein JOD57_002724 [Geodermatophilus bullaregiensis]|uniref:hypothetical protein n=1 Tax=Geodermatophilus bullaregiensis TaxID=1564160 RepID=UPI0019580578|nr:hypothetical protein [Geodermatophilus bullaregiensis]MBM7806887.1 hypothetical protein [Geodermatophilus bullaregiensis]